MNFRCIDLCAIEFYNMVTYKEPIIQDLCSRGWTGSQKSATRDDLGRREIGRALNFSPICLVVPKLSMPEMISSSTSCRPFLIHGVYEIRGGLKPPSTSLDMPLIAKAGGG